METKKKRHCYVLDQRVTLDCLSVLLCNNNKDTEIEVPFHTHIVCEHSGLFSVCISWNNSRIHIFSHKCSSHLKETTVSVKIV